MSEISSDDTEQAQVAKSQSNHDVTNDKMNKVPNKWSSQTSPPDAGSVLETNPEIAKSYTDCNSQEIEIVVQGIPKSLDRTDERTIFRVQVELAADIEAFERATVISSKCYKVDIHLQEKVGTVHGVTANFDTGTGPNLIHRDAIPTNMRGHLRNTRRL